MERDFLGIGGRDSARREEIGFFGVQPDRRYLSSMFSPRQPFVFHPAAEDRQTGITFDLLPSAGFAYIPAGDPFTSNCRFQSQKSPFFSQGPDPIPTPANSFPAMAMNKQHPLNALPAFVTPLIHRSTFNPAGATAQLTIFYAGTINVFDDVPADKARAIMFMASNAASTNFKLAGDEPGDVISGVPSASGSTVSDEFSAAPIAPRSGFQAIPQARKATLARFMEKRKERMGRVQPYMSSSKLHPRAAHLQF